MGGLGKTFGCRNRLLDCCVDAADLWSLLAGPSRVWYRGLWPRSKGNCVATIVTCYWIYTVLHEGTVAIEPAGTCPPHSPPCIKNWTLMSSSVQNIRKEIVRLLLSLKRGVGITSILPSFFFLSSFFSFSSFLFFSRHEPRGEVRPCVDWVLICDNFFAMLLTVIWGIKCLYCCGCVTEWSNGEPVQQYVS